METAVVLLPRQLSHVQVLKVLTFLSSAGMVMNGEYVSYEHLKTLVQELRLLQARLQALHLLSKLHSAQDLWTDSVEAPSAPTLQNGVKTPAPARPEVEEEEDIEQSFEDVQALDMLKF